MAKSLEINENCIEECQKIATVAYVTNGTGQDRNFCRGNVLKRKHVQCVLEIRDVFGAEKKRFAKSTVFHILIVNSILYFGQTVMLTCLES